jgi:pimeloyl-ACP methyl ester carboxylesterase
MAPPRSEYITCGGDEIHVTLWGSATAPALVMWHGLARTGRDFDEAAKALSDEYFVICPDTLGRGLSSWAQDGESGYSYRAFGLHAVAILDRLNVADVRWIGTSMGGLIGVTLAADLLKDRISHLIVNDIGPDVPEAAAERIAGYVGNPPRFRNMTELEDWLRTNYAPFGINSDAFWRRMTDTSFRRMDDGCITVHYDPRIVSQFTVHRSDTDCWPAWDAVTARTLLIRGEKSDVLPPQKAEMMTRRGPRPKLVTFAGFGHAPTLTTSEEIGTIRNFLR